MTSAIEYVDDKLCIMTERLVLRAVKEDDAQALHEIFRDPMVMLYWSEPPHQDIDRTTDWISGMIKSPLNGTTDFILTFKGEGKAIGKKGIWQHEEIGFLLGAKHWRRGLTEEALRALIPYLFVRKGYAKLTADADPENKACLGLLKKLGFEVTGVERNTFKVNTRWVDSCYLALRKEQWEHLAIAVTISRISAGTILPSPMP